MPTATTQPAPATETTTTDASNTVQHDAAAAQHANQTTKMNKESSEAKQRASSNRAPPAKNPPPPPPPPSTGPHMKKMSISRKTSKPIINWFQRKLAGTVRTRRASDGDALRNQRLGGTRSPNVKEKSRRSSVPSVPPLPGSQTTRKTKSSKPRPGSVAAKRNTISLDGTDDFSSINDARTVDSSDDYHSSLARESTWSPTSLREADEDASVRPLPPSSPPSPSPSHSSSSYLSDPRTFASMAASTKPTTLLSVDLTGGMAHIAQAPPTPTTLSHRLTPHVRTHSGNTSAGGSITFSSLSPNSASSRPPSSAQPSRGPANHSTLNAPQHTTHHPRNNPRPSSPPLDDASVLTLASSAFGIPGARIGVNALIGRASFADDSISHFSGTAGLGDSTSHFLLGEDDERLLLEDERDRDVAASVRALRPRSSRRGSWESEASGWSAQISTGVGQSGTPSVLRDRSLGTGGSYRTGARSVDVLNDDEDHPAGDIYSFTECEERSPSSRTRSIGFEKLSIGDTSTAQSSETAPDREVEDPLSTPPAGDARASSSQLTTSSIQTAGETNGVSTPGKDKCQETPKVATKPLEEEVPPALPISSLQTVAALAGQDGQGTLRAPSRDQDCRSIATSTDVFVSVPSTPVSL